MLIVPITIKVIVSKSKVRLENLVGAVSHQGERGKQPGENSECPGAGSAGSSEGAAARRWVGAAHRTCFTRCWWQSRSLPATAEQPI